MQVDWVITALSSIWKNLSDLLKLMADNLNWGIAVIAIATFIVASLSYKLQKRQILKGIYDYDDLAFNPNGGAETDYIIGTNAKLARASGNLLNTIVELVIHNKWMDPHREKLTKGSATDVLFQPSRDCIVRFNDQEIPIPLRAGILIHYKGIYRVHAVGKGPAAGVLEIWAEY